MLIIGITGTLGAGKGTVVKYLVERYGFTHHSVRDYIAQEVVQRGLPVNRDTLVATGNLLRSENGPGHIVAELCRQAIESKNHSVIESVRTLGEVEALRLGGVLRLLAVDAKPEIRYGRVLQRKSATDNISFERFLDDEAREMTSDDPNKQNVAACITKADFVLSNDGTLEDLHHQVDRVMNVILNDEKPFEISPSNL